MRSNWTFFRTVCILQILILAFEVARWVPFSSRYMTVSYLFIGLVLLITLALPMLALRVYSRNYPDIPVTGSQKAAFNWLFLLNFLLTSVLFALFFKQINWIQDVQKRFKVPITFTFIFPVILWGLALFFMALSWLDYSN